MPAPTSYALLADLHTYLNIPTAENTDDTLLQAMLDAATGMIQAYLSYDMASQVYTEQRNGWNTTVMKTYNRPIISVQSVTVDGQAIPAAANSQQPGYMFDQFCIFFTNANPVQTVPGFNNSPSIFTRGMGNVILAYTAGYATIPPVVQFVCKSIAARMYKRTSRIGEKSKSIGGQTTASYDDTQLTNEEKMVLDRYKLVVISR